MRILWVFSSVIFLSLSYRVGRAAAAAEKWPKLWESAHWSVGCAAAGLDTNRNRSQGPICVRASAEQNTKSSPRANDYPEQGAGPQQHFANHQTCKFKLAHCPGPQVSTRSSVLQYLEDSVWLIRAMIIGLEPNTEGFVSPHWASCISVMMQQFAWVAPACRVEGGGWGILVAW